MKQRCLHLWRSREGEATNIWLQDHSSDCLRWHIKGNRVKIQSILCENAVFEENNSGLKILTSNCYCLHKRGITNKAIVAVYIKLWTVRTINNLIRTAHKFILFTFTYYKVIFQAFLKGKNRNNILSIRLRQTHMSAGAITMIFRLLTYTQKIFYVKKSL